MNSLTSIHISICHQKGLSVRFMKKTSNNKNNFEFLLCFWISEMQLRVYIALQYLFVRIVMEPKETIHVFSAEVLACGECISIIYISFGLAISLVSKKLLLTQPFQQKLICWNSFYLTPALTSNYFYKMDLEEFSVETF